METSPFSRLPAELRAHTFSYVFASPYAVKLQNDTLQHALVQTCRQIRHETLAMYYSMTRFNAHLDDGPASPLLNWLSNFDSGNLQIINEVNVWDLHNLNGTLYGSETTQALLKKGPEDASKKYVLIPVEDWVFAMHGFEKVIKEIILALHAVGFGLLRFCVVNQDYRDCDSDSLLGLTKESVASPTSLFALVRLDSKPVGHIFTDCTTNIDWLAQDCELSECARAELIRGLADDHSIVEVLDGTRRIVADFTSLELGGRIVTIGNVEDIGHALTTGADREDDLTNTQLLSETPLE